MKILYFVTRIGIGGTEAVVRDLAILAQKQGYAVTIVTIFNTANHIVDELKQQNINLITFSLKNPFAVINFIKNNTYDIIHAHTEEVDFFLAFLSLFIKIPAPIIMTEHYYRYKNVCYNPFRRFMYQRFNKIICVSTEISDFLKKHVKALHDKCEVIANGVDLKKYTSCKVIEKPILHAICTARLVKQKDLTTAIRAIKYCQNPIHLSIIGDGRLRKKLTKLINHLGLENQVSLLGWSDDIAEQLKSADIYIQSSLWEGCSIAILEAMATGLPLIVSETPGIIELVGNAGLTFPLGDAKVLAKLLDDITKNFKLRHDLAQRSLHRAQDFSLDITWKKHLRLYESAAYGLEH